MVLYKSWFDLIWFDTEWRIEADSRNSGSCSKCSSSGSGCFAVSPGDMWKIIEQYSRKVLRSASLDLPDGGLFGYIRSTYGPLPAESWYAQLMHTLHHYCYYNILFCYHYASAQCSVAGYVFCPVCPSTHLETFNTVSWNILDKPVGDWISAPSPNFIAVAARVGPTTFCMVPLNRPSLKTPW